MLTDGLSVSDVSAEVVRYDTIGEFNVNSKAGYSA